MPGTSPSLNAGNGAFQANTGALWTWGALQGAGSTGLGMMAGTSPSIDADGDVAFQANTGNLWLTDSGVGGTGVAMWAGTSPSRNDSANVAYMGKTGGVWIYPDPDDEYGTMSPGDQPSINNSNDVAFHGAQRQPLAVRVHREPHGHPDGGGDQPEHRRRRRRRVPGRQRQSPGSDPRRAVGHAGDLGMGR